MTFSTTQIVQNLADRRVSVEHEVVGYFSSSGMFVILNLSLEYRPIIHIIAGRGQVLGVKVTGVCCSSWETHLVFFCLFFLLLGNPL